MHTQSTQRPPKKIAKWNPRWNAINALAAEASVPQKIGFTAMLASGSLMTRSTKGEVEKKKSCLPPSERMQ